MSLWVKGALMIVGGCVGAHYGVKLQNHLAHRYNQNLAIQIQETILKEEAEKQKQQQQQQYQTFNQHHQTLQQPHTQFEFDNQSSDNLNQRKYN
jgi:3-polyprenyl-4-hydroxybenzoate decarboxylase